MEVPQLFDLSGKTALVTGGGRGIGRWIALGLAEAGADVVVASRRQDRCRAVADEIERCGRRAWALQVDLLRPESVEALADVAVEAVGRLDILVNNAGVTWGAPTLDYPMEGWDRTFAVNVRALWQLSQRVARHMAERGGGVILHVSSVAGFRGALEERESAVAYSSSKGAVNTLTKDMAVKLAPYGIRVNGIAPGAFDTEMIDYARDGGARWEAFIEQIPLKRAGGEDDVKGAVVFLASDAGAYVNGHILVLDGGWLVRA